MAENTVYFLGYYRQYDDVVWCGLYSSVDNAKSAVVVMLPNSSLTWESVEDDVIATNIINDDKGECWYMITPYIVDSGEGF